MTVPARTQGQGFGRAAAGFVGERREMAAANTRKLSVVTPQGPKVPTHG